ncbi:spore maturation protein [bacterium]|nr:spore maturation protein [bacterium]
MNKIKPMDAIWLALVLTSILVAAWTGRFAAVTQASFDGAKAAVTLAIGLIGAMALWLGIIKVLEEAGAMKVIARLITPVMRRLFPDVPPDHPAMSSMVMNMAANALGLGNAATPLGIKAMQELDTLSAEKGTATDAMCLFLAVNTSSVTVLPLGVIAVRAAAGATEPAAILIPAILATGVSTMMAIVASLSFRKWMPGKAPVLAEYVPAEEVEGDNSSSSKSRIAIVILFFVVLVAGMLHTQGSLAEKQGLTTLFTEALIPLLMAFFLLVGFIKRVPIYETLTAGASEGFKVAVKIIPFMVAIFAATAMFRASGAMDILSSLISPLTTFIGMPTEAISMALIRPLSGSGAFGVMSEIVQREPNSFLSYLVSVMQGSTETTFYVLAVYFGAVGIRRTRYALPAALIADVSGVLAALVFSHLFF